NRGPDAAFTSILIGERGLPRQAQPEPMTEFSRVAVARRPGMPCFEPLAVAGDRRRHGERPGRERTWRGHDRGERYRRFRRRRLLRELSRIVGAAARLTGEGLTVVVARIGAALADMVRKGGGRVPLGAAGPAIPDRM